MQENELTRAAQAVALAFTKFAQAMQDFNDNLIHTNNAPAQATTTAPTIPTAPTAPVETESSEFPSAAADAPLDGEGRPWIDGLHTANKSQMNSTEKRGVKAWKFLRGTSDEVKQAYRDKYPMSDATPEAKTEIPAPIVNETAPTIPGAPPGIPAVPGAPPVAATPPEANSDNAKLRAEILKVCQTLLDSHGVTWEDLKGVFVDEFNAVQNGDEVTLGSLKESDYPAALTYLTAMEANYAEGKKLVESLYEMATPTYATNVKQGLDAIFGAFHTSELGGVYHNELDDCIGKLKEMHVAWSKWASGN